MFLGYSKDEYCSARFQTTAGPGGNRGVGGTRRRSAGGKRPTITPHECRASASLFGSGSCSWGWIRRLPSDCAMGEEAAAKLAAIPDTEALRTADEALTHSDLDDDGAACSTYSASRRAEDNAKIDRMIAMYREGVQPNFANDSVIATVCVLHRHGRNRHGRNRHGRSRLGVIDSRPSADLPDGRPALARA